MIDEMPPVRSKAFTAKKPCFSLEEGIGLEYLQWLTTSCGGGKTNREANQIGKRTMKFFMSALGNNSDENELSYEFVDCCLGSANIIISFLKTLEESWKMSSSGALNYVKAICDMVDFRKAHRVSDATLRHFTVTEVYLRRAKENLRKKKRVECTRNLDLETLISKDSWASIEDMERVVPFHLPRFKRIIEACRSNGIVTQRDLVFTTRFITTLLFLRVKCSRPMTFQYLTIEMIEKAKENEGFIDQTEFKTATTYLFDTLILTQDVIDIIDLYVLNVRPRLAANCDFLLVNLNGSQFQSLTIAMTMLVYEAIQKYINPTRYRQIVETESSDRLSLEDQRFISEDQKHSSQVAKVYYKKKQSRQVAIEGKRCMDKMTKDCRSQAGSLMELYNNMEVAFDASVLEKSRQIIASRPPCDPNKPTCSKYLDPYQPVEDLNESTDFVTTQSNVHVVDEQISNAQSDASHEENNAIIKTRVCTTSNVETGALQEDGNPQVNTNSVPPKKATKNIKFTEEEDGYLNMGIRKYGKTAWAAILKDDSLKFHDSRTRDSLRVRASSATFKKRFTNT